MGLTDPWEEALMSTTTTTHHVFPYKVIQCRAQCEKCNDFMISFIYNVYLIINKNYEAGALLENTRINRGSSCNVLYTFICQGIMH